MATVKAQCLSLLGRVESLGPGSSAAVSRRRGAAELGRRWRLQQAAHDLSVRQGSAIHRSGFSKDHFSNINNFKVEIKMFQREKTERIHMTCAIMSTF